LKENGIETQQVVDHVAASIMLESVSPNREQRDSVTKKVCQKSLLGDALDLKNEPLTY
jgi:hypothetical protein